MDINGLLDLEILEESGDVVISVPGGDKETPSARPYDERDIPIPKGKEITVDVYNDALSRLKKSYKEHAEFIDLLMNCKVVEESVDDRQSRYTDEVMQSAVYESYSNGPYFESVLNPKKREIKATASSIRSSIKKGGAYNIVPSNMITRMFSRGVGIKSKAWQAVGVFYCKKSQLNTALKEFNSTYKNQLDGLVLNAAMLDYDGFRSNPHIWKTHGRGLLMGLFNPTMWSGERYDAISIKGNGKTYASGSMSSKLKQNYDGIPFLLLVDSERKGLETIDIPASNADEKKLSSLVGGKNAVKSGKVKSKTIKESFEFDMDGLLAEKCDKDCDDCDSDDECDKKKKKKKKKSEDEDFEESVSDSTDDRIKNARSRARQSSINTLRKHLEAELKKARAEMKKLQEKGIEMHQYDEYISSLEHQLDQLNAEDGDVRKSKNIKESFEFDMDDLFTESIFGRKNKSKTKNDGTQIPKASTGDGGLEPKKTEPKQGDDDEALATRELREKHFKWRKLCDEYVHMGNECEYAFKGHRGLEYLADKFEDLGKDKKKFMAMEFDGPKGLSISDADFEKVKKLYLKFYDFNETLLKARDVIDWKTHSLSIKLDKLYIKCDGDKNKFMTSPLPELGRYGHSDNESRIRWSTYI